MSSIQENIHDAEKLQEQFKQEKHLMAQLNAESERNMRRAQLYRDALEAKQNPTTEEQNEIRYMRERDMHNNNAYQYSPIVETLYSPLLTSSPPQSISIRTITSSRWTDEQLGHVMANNGDVFEVLTQKTYFTDDYHTYALLRVNTPHRWINFSLYYTLGESPMDMIRTYIQQHNIDVVLPNEFVKKPKMSTYFFTLQPTLRAAT